MGLNDSQQAIADRIRDEAIGEILRLDPDEVGFLVVQDFQDGTGPQLYRVTLERHVDGTESLDWKLLGPIEQSDVDRRSEP